MSDWRSSRRGHIYGKRIQIARESRGLTVDDLAERLGIAPAVVEAWEAEKTTPRVSFLGGDQDEWGRLCRELDYPPGFFRKPPPPDLGRSSLDWHGYSYLCDKCDKEIGLFERVAVGDQDFHVWCAPKDAAP